MGIIVGDILGLCEVGRLVGESVGTLVEGEIDGD